MLLVCSSCEFWLHRCSMDQRSDIVTSQHDMFGPNEHRLSETLVTQEISITPPEHRTTCTSRPCHAMLLLARLYITSNQILIFIKAMSAYNDLRNLILQGAETSNPKGLCVWKRKPAVWMGVDRYLLRFGPTRSGKLGNAAKHGWKVQRTCDIINNSIR